MMMDILLIAVALTAPQDPATEACDDVCAAVLEEALSWTLEQVEGLPAFWGADPERTFLDLRVGPYFDNDAAAAREAEFFVLRRLARARDLLALAEEHPMTLACREDRGAEDCEARRGLIQLRVSTVEIETSTEATVRSGIGVLGGGGGRGHFLLRRLHLQRIEGAWTVVRATLLARS